ncbi:MAG: hypothetical protein M0R47_20580 [Methylobacter sp.]|uniref:hypothetical protein n=1 Tax=Methylobacter sp. TaxID=2051955 RepID=UPI0025EDD685|nr:hypothetical protein [Methylobacter sp.]MCK9622918.1 hypothetical protein [Methylobacter sp.]
MALTLITACGSTSGGNVTDIPGHSSASRALTEKDLANATYWINELGTFHLDNGEFNSQYGEGVTQRHKVTLDKIAFGDLDHDGLTDAAVILAWQSGGSGTFKSLMAMRNTGSAPQQQDDILLGDRVQISALSITASQVHLETVSSGPRDPACCPSQQVKQVYILHDGKWTQSADKITDSTVSTASNATFTGIVRKWERFEDTSELQHFVIDDLNKYTLIFLPDGTYRVKADCNRMQWKTAFNICH